MPLPAVWEGSKRFRYARNTNLLPPNLDRMSFGMLPFSPLVVFLNSYNLRHASMSSPMSDTLMRLSAGKPMLSCAASVVAVLAFLAGRLRLPVFSECGCAVFP